MAQFDLLLATKASGEFGTLARLVEFDRDNPQKLNFGAISAGSTQNIAAEMFKSLIGSKAVVVPFKSSPELIGALQRGDIDVAFDYLAAFASAVEDKQVQLIASAGEKRSALTPNTPTVVESGWPGFVVTSWNGVAAPAGTPQEIITQLNHEITSVLQLPEVKERFQLLGMEPAISTPEAMGERLRADIARWRDIITKLGLKP